MPKKELLEAYAKLAVKLGTNPKKGQYMIITAPVEAYEFVQMCVKEAYACGAGQVDISWFDNTIDRLNYENVETDTLKVFPDWMVERMKWRIDRQYCSLYIESSDPELLEGIDPEKIKSVRIERMKKTKQFQYYSMNNIGQWAIVAYPNKKWAHKVFPDLDEEEAYNKLWEAILYTSRVFEGQDVVEQWDSHNEEMHRHAQIMNDYAFKALHFKNKCGTDLRVGLVKNHIWCGGDETTPDGQIFNPNIPTEEVFTMPDRFHIDGTVVSTKPLNYGGKLISQFKLTFKDGRVMEAVAQDNQETLDNLLNTDEGSRSLGEVALISYDSPISKSGILFYDTLFDENASCHLALGACYPTTVKDGEKMSTEELLKLGGNDSMNHVDFMFGSEDMNIFGETSDGQMIQIFKDGNFCI